NDPEGGYIYSLNTSIKKNLGSSGVPTIVPDTSRKMDSYTGPVYGADLRWNTPLKGFMAGVSYFNQDPTTKGVYVATKIPFLITTNSDKTLAYYVEYTMGNLRFDGEYRREVMVTSSTDAKGARVAPNGKDMRGGYVSASYRLTKHLEVGGYHSRFYYDWAS